MDSWQLLLLVALLLLCGSTIRDYLRPGLRQLPGPFLARFSRIYRFYLVYKGDVPDKYRALHAKYGPIVRTGPNHVSISDPAMIPTIYGVGSKFMKVGVDCLLLKVQSCRAELSSSRQDFTKQ